MKREILDSAHWQQSERIVGGGLAIDSLRVRRLFQAACLPRQHWWGTWWRKVNALFAREAV